MTAPNLNQGTTFYFIRHGETSWNAQGILQGQHDSPLTPHGINQAQQISELYTQIPFSAIFSSDLGRAKATARIIAKSHQIPIHTSALLRERSLGQYEGHKANQVIDILKDRIHTAQSLKTRERMQFKLADDIESDQQIVNRLIRFIDSVWLSYLDQSVLVVTHEGVIRTFLIDLGFGTHDQLPRGSIENLAGIVVRKTYQQIFIIETRGIHKQMSNHSDDL